MLHILIRGSAQVLNHRVDVVLELDDLTARVDLDFTREVALSDCGRDVRDGAYLGGKVGCQQIHVVGQIFPDARCARDVGLTAQAAFDADFARDGRDLFGKDRQRVGHAVDRLR